MKTERTARISDAIEEVVMEFAIARVRAEFVDVVTGVREKIPGVTHEEVVIAIDVSIFAGDLRYDGDYIVLPDDTSKEED